MVWCGSIKPDNPVSDTALKNDQKGTWDKLRHDLRTEVRANSVHTAIHLS